MVTPSTRIRRLHLLFAAVGVLVCSWGCGSDQPPRVAVARSARVPHAEVDAFAAEFTSAVHGEDPLALDALFDWESILARATAGGRLSDAQRKAFQRGARASYEQNGLGAELRRLSARGGGIEYLRAKDVDDESRAVFRITNPQGGGVNYCELIVEKKDEGGKCVATDMFNYLTAERMSSALRRMVLLSAGRKNRELLNQASTSEEELSNLDQLMELAVAADNKDSKRVIELFEALPDALQRQKPLLLMFVRAAGKRNEEEYLAALSQLEKAHPNDPSLSMLLIDPHMVNQRFDEALKCVDQLDKSLGGDPYLHVMRAGIHLSRRDLAAAQKAIDMAIAADAHMENAYWMSLSISLQARKFAETARLLDKIRDDFKVEITDLSEVSEYVEFVASPEYELWRKANAKHQAEVVRREAMENNDGKSDEKPRPPQE